MKITVEATIMAPIEEVWRAWTTPEDIQQWNAASDEWHTTSATVDLRPGGSFSSRMEAKDGSMGFDFAGTYTRIIPHRLIEYSLEDDRIVEVEFIGGTEGVTVRETFDADSAHSVEQQRQGWQAILDSFARHVGSPMNDVQSRGGEQSAVFRNHRVLPHAPQQVFDAFSSPELLARWWGPDGFTNTFETFEFEPGGRWNFVMHGPDGSNHTNESVFLEVDAPFSVVIRHLSQPHFVLRVTLAATEGGTAIDWHQEFDDVEVAERIRRIVGQANEQNLDRLESLLAGGPSRGGTRLS